MKKIFIAVIAILLCISSNAHELQNAVKILPLNLPLNTLSLEYERMLNEKNSVEFGIGIPLKRTFVNKFGMDWAEEENISSDDFGVFNLRAGYRHYTGKSMLPKGFYVAPYLKLLSMTASADNVRHVTDTEVPYSYDENYDVKAHTFSIGCQLGYQFLISERMTIDLFFFGLEAGLGSIDGTVYSSNLEEAGNIQEDIQQEVDDLPNFLRKRIKVGQDENYVHIEGKNIIHPWYRGGFSLGVAF